MSEPKKWLIPDGEKRRWVQGAGESVPAFGEKLLAKGRGKKNRITSLGRLVGKSMDQVAAEHLLQRLCDAGLVSIHERINARGDFEPYEWKLTEKGEKLCCLERDPLQEELDRYLAESSELDEQHPVLESIKCWVSEGDQVTRRPTLGAILLAIGRAIRKGEPLHARMLSLSIQGNTKTVRIEEFRAEVEDALGCDLENAVRLLGRSVLIFGPLRFAIKGRIIDAEWSVPWLALTQNTIEELSDIQVRASSLITIENQAAFEEFVRRGLPEKSVALYTGGFPGSLEKQFIAKLAQAGIKAVHHWGDLDLGGLRILRHLKESLPIPVTPLRMEAELLEQLPTQPLTENDIEGLKAWTNDPKAPCQTLAREMLRLGKKAEQEGWFLVPHRS